jgi:hypothetical protein
MILNNGGYMTKNYQMLKEQINYTISNSGLDIGAAYFIMKDIMSNLERLYYAQINKELLDEKETKDKEQEVKTSSESSNKSN